MNSLPDQGSPIASCHLERSRLLQIALAIRKRSGRREILVHVNTTDYISLQAKIFSMRDYTFYVYILTNPGKAVLYIGVTNDLTRRLQEHYDNRGNPKSFTGRYYCYKLIYYEIFQYISEAIGREKQLKKWSRKKKENLIKRMNPGWHTLNGQFYLGDWI
jgi:putative endonuclease